jgi:G3E family GTPase
VKALNDLLDMDQREIISHVERVIIETSGLADPAPIIFTILNDPVLQHHYFIDQVMVTVDAVNGNLHLDRQPESVKQISAADKIIVTKTDLATPEVITGLVARIQSLNPSVQVLEAIAGELELTEFLRLNDTNSTQTKHTTFSFRPTRMNDSTHVPDTASLSLTFDQPLDWTAFGLWLSMLLHARGQDVLRVKGLIDVGEEGPVVLNGVQHIIHPPQHLDSWPSNDQRSHLVFIMRSIHPSAILASLNAFQNVLGASPILLETNIHV